MLITLHDARTLRIARPADAYDTLAALTGAQYDKASRSLSVPLYHLRRILDRFPQAPVADKEEAIEARLDLWRKWIRQFNDCGVWFALAHDGETVQAVGEGVSPLFADWVAGMSPVLRQFLHVQHFPAHAAPPPAPAPVDSSEADKLIWAGMQKARRAEERRAEVVGRAKVSRWKVRV